MNVPVLRQLGLFSCLIGNGEARRHLTDVFIDSFWTRDIQIGQIVPECRVVSDEVNLRESDKRFDFRGKGKAATVPIIIKWLDTETVTRQSKGAVALVP